MLMLMLLMVIACCKLLRSKVGTIECRRAQNYCCKK
jgi:hypothetical protein